MIELDMKEGCSDSTQLCAVPSTNAGNEEDALVFCVSTVFK